MDSILDKVRSLIKSSPTPSPKTSQLGLGNTESPKLLSPLKTKPSVSNLFDDTADLFDIEGEELNIPDAPNSTPESFKNSPSSTDANLGVINEPESSLLSSQNLYS